MAGIEDKLANFSAFVLDEANKKKSDLIKECEQRNKQIIEKKEMEYLADAYADIQTIVSKYSKENNERVLKVEMSLKKDLLLKRERIIKEVFDEVTNKIETYTNSQEYGKWLMEKAIKACEEVGKGKKTIYVTEKDIKYKENIEFSIESVNVVVTDEDDFLGGIKVYNTDRHVFVDYSIKQMMEDEKHLFLQTSGLKIG